MPFYVEDSGPYYVKADRMWLRANAKQAWSFEKIPYFDGYPDPEGHAMSSRALEALVQLRQHPDSSPDTLGSADLSALEDTRAVVRFDDATDALAFKLARCGL